VSDAALFALYAWIATVLVGLLLLIIWLMEYDRDFQSAAATRLPVPVISTHALLGLGGLALWGFYLVTDTDSLPVPAVIDLGLVVLLGLIMAARWLQVLRAYPTAGSSLTRVVVVPPERHFPRPVIVIHGVFALVTVVLVVFATFFSGS
jgi:manganese efflux pump family protein